MLDVGWGDLLSHGKDPNTHSMSRARGGFLLKEYESKQLLSTCGIPTVDTRIALTQK
jgi:hypothetical protein